MPKPQKLSQPAPGSLARWRAWAPGLALVLAVIVVYLPIWQAGFIWDDDAHVTANPVVVGPLGWLDIWTTPAAQYYPLVLTSFRIEHLLWGLQPLGYHLVNVLLHAVCAVLLGRCLLALRVPGAWLGAALWALHPVQVESVAWISEMKNTQSGLFYLLSILFFVRATRLRSARQETRMISGHDGLAWLFAALAMASKSSTAVLPLVLLLCAWWLDGKWRWSHLARVVPVFLLAIAAAFLAVWTVKLQGVDFNERGWPARLALAGDVPWFYLGKLIWPHPLVFIYARWNPDSTAWTAFVPLALLIALAIALWAWRKTFWGRAGLFAFAYFLAALLPVLGLVNHYFLRYSFVADHLQYLADMGPLAALGAGVTVGWERATGRIRLAYANLACALLLILAGLSWHRIGAYQNQEKLWTDTLAKNPDCWLAENNLGNIRFREGQLDAAIAHYRRALEISPALAEVDDNLGVALARAGQPGQATDCFERALGLDPDLASAHDHLGNALLQNGRVDDAIEQFRAAARLDPYHPAAAYNLANALLARGDLAGAESEYRDVLRLHPDLAEAHSNLGLILLQNGHAAAAITEFQRAIALQPNYAQAHNNLGLALAQTGQFQPALAEFQEAIRLQPDYPAAQNNLARARLILEGESHPQLEEVPPTHGGD